MDPNIKRALKTIRDAVSDLPSGDRHLIVLDRGWIFAGNLFEISNESGNFYTLTNAKNVRRWEKGGFGGLSQSATQANATLDDSAPIKFSGSAMIFCVPISEDWDV